MLYKLEVDLKEDILWVNVSGTRSIETVLAIINEIFSACTEQNIYVILVDVRKLEGRLTTINTFNLATRYFPKLRELNVIQKAAVVDLKEFEHNYKFFENLTKKGGYKLQFFSDLEAARTWLKE